MTPALLAGLWQGENKGFCTESINILRQRLPPVIVVARITTKNEETYRFTYIIKKSDDGFGKNRSLCIYCYWMVF